MDLAMMTVRRVDFEIVDPDGVLRRIRILKRCTFRKYTRFLLTVTFKKRLSTPYRHPSAPRDDPDPGAVRVWVATGVGP